MAQPSVVGQWGAPFSWPIVASHAAVLADGRVFAWSDVIGIAPRIWDPATGQFTIISGANTTTAGSASAILADGDIAVIGGRSANGAGITDAHAYDVGANTWSSIQYMAQGRNEPTGLFLGDGRLLALSGERVPGQPTDVHETTTPGTPWTSLQFAVLGLPRTPWAFVLTDTTVLVAGPDRNARRLDPRGDGIWSFIDAMQSGPREAGTAVLLPGSPNRVLAIGGRNPATSSCEVLDLLFNPTWEVTGSMARARRFHSATTLADGTILVTGGTLVDDSLEHAVYSAERYVPQSGTWSTLASMSVPRRRGSIALLLPDGRVLCAGGGDGTPGSETHADAQIFQPPYLFLGPRPTITAAPTSILYGGGFTVDTPQAADVDAVWIVRAGSVSRGFNADQRAISLGFTVAGSRLSITAPQHPYITPPGTHILFLITDLGVPSIGRMMNLKVGIPPPVAPHVTSTPPPTAIVGAPYTYIPTATGTLPITWSLTSAPAWLSVSPSSGAVAGVPAAIGSFNVSLRASNAGGNETQSWTLQVTSSQTGVHTIIPLGDTWRYFKGNINPPANWAALGFVDSAWLTGPSGFGFGDGDDATILTDMQSNYSTIFTRKTFTLFNVNTVSKVSILFDYDDGFAVYLNGTRIFSMGAPATITNTSLATSSHEAIFTLTRRDFTDTATRSLLVNGTNVLAAVGLNQTLSGGDLTLKIVLETTGGTSQPVDTEGGEPPSRETAWLGAGPNPFIDRARIAFRTPVAGRVSLDVYDTAGRLVRRIVMQDAAAGEHAILWDGLDAAGHRAHPGVYVYRLRAPGLEHSGKLIRTR